MKHLAVALCVLFLISRLEGQEVNQELMQPHEFTLAFGTASSSEKSAFNLPANDIRVSPSFSFYLGYYYSFTEQIAVGSHIIGYSQTIKGVGVTDASNNFKIVSFDFLPYNIGLQGRYLLLTGTAQPFLSAMINFVGGSLQNNEYGTLTIFGFTAGGTAGVRIFLFESVTISVQGFASFGSASFKDKPFLNSVGKDFDPSMTGVILGAAYHWGDF